jgi:hypothetical protein
MAVGRRHSPAQEQLTFKALLRRALQSFNCQTMKTRQTFKSFAQPASADATKRAFLLPLLLNLTGDRRAR